MYYPLSQIRTNLFTNGGEYLIESTLENYIGFYWKTSQETFFTGKTPQSLSNPQKLVSVHKAKPTPTNPLPYQPTPNPVLNSIYSPSNFLITQYPKYSFIDRYSPSYVLPHPTTQEYQQGYFTRYFCKKSNEFVYLEIDKDTYDKLKNKDPKILYQLYVPFTLKWQLVGDKEKVYNTNKNIIELVMRDQKMYLLNRYLKENYTQFWKSN